jgi:hypothetical protein
MTLENWTRKTGGWLKVWIIHTNLVNYGYVSELIAPSSGRNLKELFIKYLKHKFSIKNILFVRDCRRWKWKALSLNSSIYFGNKIERLFWFVTFLNPHFYIWNFYDIILILNDWITITRFAHFFLNQFIRFNFYYKWYS